MTPRLRVVSDTGQNLLIDPISGGVAAVGASLAYAVGDPHFGATPQVTALAYSPNDPFATSATAYGLDQFNPALVRLGSPDPADGTLHTVAFFNRVVVGFDVSRVSGIAFAVQPGFTPALADDIALPPSWIQEGYEAGKLSGPQPASLFLLQGYWAGINCPAGSNPEACTANAMNRETVWLVRVGSESSGYERWMNQSQNLATGQWLDPVPGNIGTTASVAFEGNSPILPAVPCHR